ncbi:sushi, von Willebrand factor type A, EGF and pentraxin domain-containing protein 1-like isoform X2 [Trematomus bernacchii]|uniref:sushi, von Willebrand factor type A, EGF and pentraxin domain-containing protein 1-like isoform X2 n=1 Tax=Trematomus bernacchii TaxID=40690 RepID=UPI00146A951F|nr:sushi, von Willebrand factor type A, EGF and pentraxin domain-containing protein 1-like isoform X2 [Trematomus bernacchii]
MSVGYLGFVLLLWFPGVLHAHNETQNCNASSPSGGYVVPEQETYLHETTLTYGCDNGFKPAVEGWWATSICQNGKWSPKPQCIDEKACVPLTIPNGNYDVSTDGWYGEREKIRVKCDEGYEHKDNDATAQCINGAWSSVPICERSTESCGDPPKIPHAVIIGQGYQEVFAASSKLQYNCKDGYSAEGAETKEICCISGNWTEGPMCNRRPDTGGSTEGGTGGGHTTSAGSGIQPAGGGSSTGHGGATGGGTGRFLTSDGSGMTSEEEVGSGGGHITSAGSGIQPAGGDRRPDTGHGGSTVGGTGGGHTTSPGSGQPAGGGSSTGHGGATGGGTEVGSGGGHTTSAGSGIQPAGGDRRPDTGHGGPTVGGSGGGHTTSAGSGIQPAGGDRRPDTGHGGSTVGGTGGGHTTSPGSGQPAGGAQSAAQPCPAPSLNGGFFSPGQSAYNHEATLSYACHDGLKPAVKGWWGTSRCQNGNWSPKPQCIDEKACVPLTIPNGNYDVSTNGWYGERDKIWVRCDEGYKHKDYDTTAQCINGAWSSVPICERSTESCGDPPKIPHAVIIGKGYQEVFSASSKLQYNCKDGYSAEGAETKEIFCISGNWTEGPTCTQSAAQPCPAPSLNGGLFSPGQSAYNHEATLSYACHDGLKPAVKGWWGTSRCQNGNWSPKPQCIDEKACVPLTIPNGNYDASTNGWYGERDKIWVRCDEGYKHKDYDTTAQCINGAWSSVPICERSTESCGDPPKIPHAVIIGKGYQEVFAASSKLQYNCKDGYSAEGAETKEIFCISGNWTEGPMCKVGSGGGHTTSAGSGIQPADRRPDTGHGGSTVGGTGGGHTTSAGSGIQPAGGDRRPDTGHGGSTVGGTGGGHTTSAGSGQPAGGDANCGDYPSVPNGDVVQVSGTFLKYQCNGFYTLEGPDIVTCQSNGKWTEPPSCKAAFCVIDPAQTTIANVIISAVEYVKEGQEKYIPCTWDDFSRRVQCINGRIAYTNCCSRIHHYNQRCPVEGT